ncbi:MAG: DEAD/DEAH box helicase [Candidatus Brockarchaeota archaeon]|nr:DEAD/DEAH box helicase [Candidatus Brockarchaeota archaeon]
MEGKNLVLACPTASGKTLVAMVLMLESVFKDRGKCLYLVPLRALASEKYSEFKLFQGSKKPNGGSLRVAISTGDYDSPASHLANKDIIVATYEKCDSVIRHRPPWLSSVSLVVLDEIHLIDSIDRGPTLEMLATWLKSVAKNAQVLALSATIENSGEIAEWLGAANVVSDWRPVPLREGVFFGYEITYKNGEKVAVQKEFGEPHLDLAAHVIRDGGQILFFTETRRSAVAMSRKLTPVTWLNLSSAERRKLAEISSSIHQSVERTKLSEALSTVLARGAAFHHAGLHNQHREVVESFFKKGLIKALAATPTLAAGVNLPARVVAITSLRRYDHVLGSKEISIMEYKQMAGRAGRPRYDKAGDAIIFASNQNDADYLMETYVGSPPEPVVSKLGAAQSIASHTLATIASGLAHNAEELHQVFSSTLLAKQRGYRGLRPKVEDALAYLIKEGAVTWKNGGFVETGLGRRIAELYVDPSTAFHFRDCMNFKPKNFNAISMLHMITSSTDIQPVLYTRSSDMPMVEGFISEHKQEIYLATKDEKRLVQDEVKTLMTLWFWIEERGEDEIADVMGAQQGDLYRLVESAVWLLYSARELAPFFGHKELVPKLGQLEARVRHGVRPELLELVSLSGIGRVRARNLYKNGFRSIQELRRSSVSDLTRVPGVGSKLATKIKAAAGGKLKGHAVKAKRDEVQTTLEDFDREFSRSG